MATIERGTALVQKALGKLMKRPSAKDAVGATPAQLDRLESKLMVELPPTLRLFLATDYTFVSLGKKFEGKHRFGKDPAHPEPKITSVRKLAEARTEFGWTDSRLKGKVVRLPNLIGQAWNALYLGEARRDGELVILGIDNDETNVRVYPRYTAFDLYIGEQAGLFELEDGERLDEMEEHVDLNPELGSSADEEEEESDY